MGQRDDHESTGDEELVRRTLAGDREAFGGLVRRYEDRICATVQRIVGHREDALDLAQETFLRAFDRLRTFREGARFSTWLYTIALNVTRSELRKRKARKAVKPMSLEGAEHDPPDRAEAGTEAVDRREQYEAALRALGELDPESREVVVLRDIEDLSYEEIAQVLGVPTGTVRSRLHRAREELRVRLSESSPVRPSGEPS